MPTERAEKACWGERAGGELGPWRAHLRRFLGEERLGRAAQRGVRPQRRAQRERQLGVARGRAVVGTAAAAASGGGAGGATAASGEERRELGTVACGEHTPARAAEVVAARDGERLVQHLRAGPMVLLRSELRPRSTRVASEGHQVGGRVGVGVGWGWGWGGSTAVARQARRAERQAFPPAAGTNLHASHVSAARALSQSSTPSPPSAAASVSTSACCCSLGRAWPRVIERMLVLQLGQLRAVARAVSSKQPAQKEWPQKVTTGCSTVSWQVAGDGGRFREMAGGDGRSWAMAGDGGRWWEMAGGDGRWWAMAGDGGR